MRGWQPRWQQVAVRGRRANAEHQRQAVNITTRRGGGCSARKPWPARAKQMFHRPCNSQQQALAAVDSGGRRSPCGWQPHRQPPTASAWQCVANMQRYTVHQPRQALPRGEEEGVVRANPGQRVQNKCFTGHATASACRSGLWWLSVISPCGSTSPTASGVVRGRRRRPEASHDCPRKPDRSPGTQLRLLRGEWFLVHLSADPPLRPPSARSQPPQTPSEAPV
jgi:hypothetical protein